METEVTGPLLGLTKRADLELGLPGDAVDGRDEPREIEIDFRRFDSRLQPS